MAEDAGGLSEQEQKRRMEARARAYIEEYKYQVAALFGLPIPRSIWVHEVFNHPTAAAYVNETGHDQPVMTLNFSYLRKNPDELEPVVVHELGHVVIAATPGGGFGQYGPDESIPWAFNEGLAQYASTQLTGRHHVQWGQPAPLHNGYQSMAHFLQWQEKRVPGTARGLAHLLANQTLDTLSFADLVGTPLHEAIAEYRAGAGSNLKSTIKYREYNKWLREWTREETERHDRRFRHATDYPRPDASFVPWKPPWMRNLGHVSVSEYFSSVDTGAIAGLGPANVVAQKEQASRGDPTGPKPQPNPYNPVHQQI